MHGATLCQALLQWKWALGVSQVLQSFHLPSKQPKTFLPRLSEEFSSVLTPFILDIYVSSSPSAFLTSIWKQNLEPGVLSPSQAHHLLTSELPKRFRNSPVWGVQIGVGTECPQSPGTPVSPQEHLVLLGGEGLVLTPLKLSGWSPPECPPSVPDPPFSSMCSPQEL